MALRDFALVMGAGQIQELGVRGNFFGVLEATGAVYFSVDNGPFTKRAAGHYQRGEYRHLRVKSLVAQNVLLLAGEGDFFSANQAITVNTTATVEPGNLTPALADVVIAAGATSVIAAANVDRKKLVIKALYSNDAADIIRVGTGAGAAAGVEMGAGEAFEVETEGAISAHNPGANPFTVSLLEINRV